MTNTIAIQYPVFLANSMRLNDVDFANEIKTSGIVKLFELGKISSGIAAKVLGTSRIEFLELLEQYKVSYLNVDYLDTDFKNA